MGISGLLTVSAATVQNNLFVNGSTLSAGSATATLSALNVANAVGISGLLTVSAATVNNNLFLNGRTLSAGAVTATLSSLNVTNAVGISGLLTVSAATIQNNLSVLGLTTLSGTTTTSLSATSLVVTGITTLSSTVTTNSGVAVGGNLTAPTATITTITLSALLGLTSINSMSANIVSASSLICIGANTNQSGGPTNVNAFGAGAGFMNSGSRVNFMGSAGSNNRGADVNAFGVGAAGCNSGTYVNAFGISAGFLNQANYLNAVGAYAGENNSGLNLNAIGFKAGLSNRGISNTSIGDFAGSNQGGSSNIALGLNALMNNSGNLVVGIGYNAGKDASATGCIYIGQEAGSNNRNSNTIFLGSNPGYNVSANTFVVYSTVSAAPALQTNLSARWLGVGKAPAFSLDVSGTIQVSNISAGQLAGVTLSLGTTNPSSGFVLTFSNSAIQWLAATGGAGGGSAWSEYPATQFVNFAGYNLSGLAFFNNVPVVFKSTQIGIATNLSGNNGVTVALGISAGISGGGGIYLGSNAGYYPTDANTFLVYSTSATRPFLQGNLANICLGIGRAPGAHTLDVSGSIGGTSLNIPLNTTTNTPNRLGPISTLLVGGVNRVGINNANPGYTLDVAGTVNADVIRTSNATSSSTIGGVTMSNSILTVSTISNLTNINGQNLIINGTTGLIGIGPNMTLGGASNIAIGNYAGAGYNQTGDNEGGQLIAIGGSAGYSSSGVSNTFLGWHAGEWNSGSFVNAIGWRAGESNTGSDVNSLGTYAAWSNAASFVDAIGSLAGYQNASTGTNLIAIGSNAGRGNRGASNIYIGARAGNGSGTQFNSNSSNAIVIGSLAGVHPNTNSSIGNRSINIGSGSFTAQGSEDQIAIGTGAYGAGTGSIAIGVSAYAFGPKTIVIGSNVGSGPIAADVIAIGTNAGSNLSNLNNNIYIGSNAGYRPTTSNTFVLYSTSTGVAALQSDLSNRWLGVGCVPTVPLDVAGQIRTTSNIINTINVTTISAVGTLALSAANYSTYFNLVYNGGTTVTVSLPGTTPLNGSYWVLKNNSTVNYTIAYTGGVLNYVGGPTSSYLQAGNGVTLIYAGANSVYYTF